MNLNSMMNVRFMMKLWAEWIPMVARCSLCVCWFFDNRLIILSFRIDQKKKKWTGKHRSTVDASIYWNGNLFRMQYWLVLLAANYHGGSSKMTNRTVFHKKIGQNSLGKICQMAMSLDYWFILNFEWSLFLISIPDPIGSLVGELNARQSTRISTVIWSIRSFGEPTVIVCSCNLKGTKSIVLLTNF